MPVSSRTQWRVRPRVISSALVLVVVAIVAAPAFSSAHAEAQEPVDLEMIERIHAEATEGSEVLDLYNMLTNVIGPRLSGSPSYDRSAQWAREWLEGIGLSDARLEGFYFGRGWTLEKFSLEMTSPRYMPLLGYPEAWTPSTVGRIEGRPHYVGDRTREEIEALAPGLRGGIVLTHRPQTVFTRADRPQPTDSEDPVRTGAPARAPGEVGSSETPLNEMRSVLADAGAGVVLRPSRGEHGTVYVLGNRSTPDDAAPSLVLAAEHYNMVVRLIEAGEPVELAIEVGTRYHEDDPVSHNVLADLRGTDPQIGHEVVLIGGHLDSWHAGTGATDNADGIAVAMEAMRILKALGVEPRRTIRIALWGGEEQGLLGSRSYVEEHLEGPGNEAAHEALSVYLNDDPGAGFTYGWYMEENQAAKEIFDAWLEPLRELGARRNVFEGIPSTDHLSFTRVGIPAFTAIKDYTNYDTRTHHTNADLYERVGEEELVQAAIVLAVFAWHAAQRDERIPRDGMGTGF
ncbi:MAG: M20/M25/M40 family metallo-hydrolase [Gemmatimonadales bacterium]|nr:MAG: M20/M25/M40 family metallo-hydrolase [Gemmatimonadales bacterium]